MRAEALDRPLTSDASYFCDVWAAGSRTGGSCVWAARSRRVRSAMVLASPAWPALVAPPLSGCPRCQPHSKAGPLLFLSVGGPPSCLLNKGPRASDSARDRTVPSWRPGGHVHACPSSPSEGSPLTAHTAGGRGPGGPGSTPGSGQCPRSHDVQGRFPPHTQTLSLTGLPSNTF